MERSAEHAGAKSQGERRGGVKLLRVRRFRRQPAWETATRGCGRIDSRGDRAGERSADKKSTGVSPCLKAKTAVWRRAAESALDHPDAHEVAGEKRGVERLGVKLQRRGLEHGTVPEDVFAGGGAHHGRRLGCSRGLLVRLKVRNGEGHGVSSVGSSVVGIPVTLTTGEGAAEFLAKQEFQPSGPLSKSWPEIYREGQFAAELMRRRQGGCAKDGRASRCFFARRDEDGLAVALLGRGPEAEEMHGRVHWRMGFGYAPFIGTLGRAIELNCALAQRTCASQRGRACFDPLQRSPALRPFPGFRLRSLLRAWDRSSPLFLRQPTSDSHL